MQPADDTDGADLDSDGDVDGAVISRELLPGKLLLLFLVSVDVV
jgi:hypothetical protein